MTIVKTYAENIYTGDLVHDGYFILVEHTPLKWISLEALEALPNASEPKYSYTALAEEVRTA